MIINHIQLFTSIWMLSVIWFVQIVHYPLFSLIPKIARIEFATKHQYLISWIVVIPMLVELVTIFLIDYSSYEMLWVLSIICLIIIWASTFILQVPCHNQLLINPTDQVILKLIKTNWIRTIFWTLKTILIYMII